MKKIPFNPTVRHHAYSTDPARDRAVRLAEDGVAERPTLEEAIAGVWKLPKTVSASSALDHENKGESMGGNSRTYEQLDIANGHLSDMVMKLGAERDAAIRERDELREQLESVACRAATAETALEARISTAGDGSCAAQAASGYVGGDGVVLECDDCGKRFWLDDTSGGSHRMLEPDNAFGGELWETYCPACTAQAASGGGDHFADASKMVEHPRGWLTEEEREQVRFDMNRHIRECVGCIERETKDEEGAKSHSRSAEVLERLLARNAPPRVKMPPAIHKDILAALAAAGVEVESQS